ncbi:hypothetical protein Y1Q_0001007 [Alligator mississippiensis]|uniref:Uncharacterized protein n=1 Tax=Alligator mississippiensis TaxID=8496 RepID=A0A151NEP6_ALLMI|nr:hypothetical protein Y1Q_0001007 [Alligator mississippiensis]
MEQRQYICISWLVAAKMQGLRLPLSTVSRKPSANVIQVLLFYYPYCMCDVMKQEYSDLKKNPAVLGK